LDVIAPAIRRNEKERAAGADRRAERQVQHSDDAGVDRGGVFDLRRRREPESLFRSNQTTSISLTVSAPLPADGVKSEMQPSPAGRCHTRPRSLLAIQTSKPSALPRSRSHP
jgi:hypothetical protein